VAAFLPYLILFARNLAPKEGGKPDGKRPATAVSLAAGVLAALGCALKPQYGLVFAALEIVALRHRMRPWRPAPVAAAAALLGYVGLVAYACPAYLRHAVPMAMALYGATDVSFLALFKDSAPLLAAEALVAFLWWRDRRDWRGGPRGSARGSDEGNDLGVPSYPVLLQTGMIFAAASTVICFIDGKDWFYHRLPATVVTVLMLVLWSAAAISRRAGRATPGGIAWHSFGDTSWRTPGPAAARTPWGGLIVAGLVVALFCVAAVRRLEPQVQQAVEPKATTVARLEALIRLHHARTYIAFSEWIALGFPVVNNTGVVWASRFDSMWALKGELWRAHIDPAAAKEWPITHWVAHDFIATCPDIAVVDTREGLNYIAVLSAAEPSFAHAWSRYKQIVAFDGLKVYKRGKGGCIDPWIAAEGPGNGITIR
jgi:hypothetical protein